MAFKSNIDGQIRGFYFAASGDDQLSGETLEVPKLTIQAAINAAAALIPVPSATDLAIVSASQGGSFTNSFVMADFVQVNGVNTSINATAAIAITMANSAELILTSAANSQASSTVLDVTGKTFVASFVGVLGTIGASSIGASVSGTVSNIFFDTPQVLCDGTGSTAFSITSTNTTAVDINVDTVNFLGNDTTFIDHNPANVTDVTNVSVSSIEKNSSTGTTAFLVQNGLLSVESAGTIDAADAIQVTGAGTLIIDANEINGDITVDAGATLKCNIRNFTGTLTNNGTIQGTIFHTALNETVFYGDAAFNDVISIQGGVSLQSPIEFSDGSTQIKAASPNLFEGRTVSAILNQTFDVTAQDTQPHAVFFREDGIKMYVSAAITDTVLEYDLSTGWDISTAVFNQSFDVSSQESNIRGLFFKEDGLRMYITGSAGMDINQYDLGTAWDISTAVFDTNFSLAAQTTLPIAVVFNPLGFSFYIADFINGFIRRYNMTTAWDVATASFSGDSFDTSGTIGTLDPGGVCFRLDGAIMYVLGDTEESILEYFLTTPWDITTAQFEDVRIENIEAMRGLCANHYNEKLFFVSASTALVYDFNLGIALEGGLSAPQTLTINPSGDVDITTPVNFLDGSTQIQASAPGQPPRLNTINLLTTFDASGQISDSNGIWISRNGLKLYLADDTTLTAFEYTLTVPFDTSTMTYSGNSLVRGAAFESFALSSDGTQAYFMNLVGQFTIADLSTAFDLSTAGSFFTATPSGLSALSSVRVLDNGIDVFFMMNGGVILQWEMTVPNNLDTLVDTGNSFTDAGIGNAAGLDIFNDRRGFVTCDPNTDTIFHYALDVPGDITSARLIDSFLDSGAGFVEIAAASNTSKLFTLQIASGTMRDYTLGLGSDALSVFDGVNTGNLTIEENSAIAFGNESTQNQAPIPGGTAFNLKNLYFENSEDVSAEIDSVRGMWISQDGLKLYIADVTSQSGFEYDMTVPWDTTTLSYSGNSINISTNMTDIALKPDGTKVWFMTFSGDFLERTLSTPFDFSTAGGAATRNTTASSTNGFVIKPDGLSLYFSQENGTVLRWSMTIPYDLSTLTDTGESFATGITPNSTDLIISDDGRRFIMCGNSTTINLFEMTVPWDITTAVLIDTVVILGAGNIQNTCYAFDNSKLFFASAVTDTIEQYAMGEAFDILVYEQSPTVIENIQDNAVRTAESGHIATGKFIAVVEDTALPAPLLALEVSYDGLKYFVAGNDPNINVYNMTVPFDITSGTLEANNSFNAGFSVQTLGISPDGLNVITPSGGGIVRFWTLGSPFDFDDSTQGADVSPTELTGTLVSCSSSGDGRFFYIHDDDGGLFQYSRRNWEDQTLTYTGNTFSFGSTSNTQCSTISSDGRILYVKLGNNDDLREYTLTTPWDVSTAILIDTNTAFFDNSLIREIVVIGNASRIYGGSTDINNGDVGEYSLGESTTTLLADDVTAVNATVNNALTYLDGSTESVAVAANGITNPIANSTFVQAFDVSAQETAPNDVHFRPDGLRFYIIGNSSDRVNQYHLSTAWDVSTAVFNQFLNVNSEDAFPEGLFFKPDGTKLYFVGQTGDNLYEYDLSTAWDVSTGTLTNTFDLSSEDITPVAVWFRPDGLAFFMFGFATNDVFKYDVVTPWDTTNASYSGVSFSLPGSFTSLRGGGFNEDGRSMYATFDAPDEMAEFRLSTPWNITTAVLISTLSTSSTLSRGFCLNSAEGKLYVVDGTNDTVREYDLGLSSLRTDNLTTSSMVTYRDGSTQIAGATPDGVGWHPLGLRQIQTFDVGNEDLAPVSMFTRVDGLKLFITGDIVDEMFEYDLTVPWDLSTISYSGNSDSTIPALPVGQFWKYDGTRMYVLPFTTGLVEQFDLDTPWSLTGSTSSGTFDVVGPSSGPEDITFKPDGTAFYVIDIVETIRQFDMSTPWDLNSASDPSISLDVSTDVGNGAAVAFRPDGSVMLVGDNVNDSVHRYDLAVPWDILTAVHIEEFLLSGVDNLVSMSFKGDGTKAFLLEETNNLIHEYDLDLVTTNLVTTTVNGRVDSLVSDEGIEIFTSADLDALASGGVITVASPTNLIFKDDILTTNVFDVTVGPLTISAPGEGFSLTYIGTGTLFSGSGSLVIRPSMQMTSGSTGTLFNMDLGDANLFIHQDSSWINWDTTGTIKGGIVLVQNMNNILWATPLILDSNVFADVATLATALPPSSGNMISIVNREKENAIYRFTNTTGDLSGTTTSLYKIDPSILDSTQVTIISGAIINGGGNFDTAGSTGTFTAVADASVAATAITSVTDSSGVARFNFTVGPTLHVNQEVVISTFVTNTAYNGTFFITTTGVGFFEVASIDFGTDETGSFLSNSVSVTSATHGLGNGQSLVIDSDLSTDYDGGAVTYQAATNTFRINRTFTATQTGTWDTSGLNQKDPRVLAQLQQIEIDSKYIGCAFVNDNSTANGAIVNNTFTDMVFGTAGTAMVECSNAERWKLVDELNGTLEYTGTEPFDGTIGYDFSVVSSGGAVEFRFKWVKDPGGGFADLDDDVQALADVASTATSVSKTQPLTAVTGDLIKPQITRNSGTSGITARYATVNVTQ